MKERKREREKEIEREIERELLSNLHSSLRGYASTFEWSGQHSDETTRDRWGRKETQVVAIDALVFRSMMSQLRPGEREKKCYYLIFKYLVFKR